MRYRHALTALLAGAVTGLFACADAAPDSPSPENNPEDQVRSSGMTLTSDTLADTDVARMQFDVTGVDCATGQQTGFNETKTRELADMMLPGGISTFENAPFDEDSQHLFADAFFLVDAGCYDVRTQPLDDQGQPSQDCEDAHRDRVSVEDGQTTEILLINQCEGAERGGLDVVSSINHPPEIENLAFEKFLASCPTTTAELEDQRVCVTASDPDNDPLEFQWETVAAGEFTGDIAEVSSEQRADGTWESCADVSTIRRGEYQFRVDVYDLDGNGNRLEDVLAQQDDRDAHPSRDSLQFPVYAGDDCPDVGELTNPTTLRQLAEVKTATRPYLDHARALQDFARFTVPIPGRGVNHIRRSLITDAGTVDWDRPFEEGSAEHRRTPGFLWFSEPSPGNERLLSVEYAVPATQDPPTDLFAGDLDDDAWHIHPAVEELIPPARPSFQSIEGACHYDSGAEFYLAVTTDGRRVFAAPPTGEILPNFGNWSDIEPSTCPATGPLGTEFLVVHEPIWTLNVWLYRDNPAGVFHGSNPELLP